ncbi:MAG: DEAD/DEAH box helicase [Candidatus Pacearchaeota archaeon]
MKILENITPRKYQKDIFENCINKNCLVVIPTGLGKTLIALMLTVERMKKFPGEKVVFLAPTKPLAEQHLNYFKDNLPELFGDFQLFTGSIKPKQRQKIWETADIIFSTPQCVANDLKNRLYSLEDVCLLVEDEAHRCVRNYDYNYVAKKYKEQSKNQRILGLTASPGSNSSKIREICKNLSIEEVELRTRDSPDVSQYLQELKFEKVHVDLHPEFNKIRDSLDKLLKQYISELRNRRVLFGPANKGSLIKLQKNIMSKISRGYKDYNLLLSASACATAIKIQHSLELLETQTLFGFHKYLKELSEQAKKKKSRGVVKLVSNPEFKYSFMKSKRLLGKNIEHPKILKLFEIVKEEKSKNTESKIMIFSQFRDTAHLISDYLNDISEVKSRVFIGQAKKSSHSGRQTGLSQKEQKGLLQEFSTKKINVLCATSIGEEGLDIPEVNTVIFYEPIPSAIRSIQRAGRTARMMEGKLIMLITKETRDEAHFYISKAKEKRMKNAIKTIKKNLSGKQSEGIQKNLNEIKNE